MDKSKKRELLKTLDFGAPDAEEEGRKTMDVFVIPPSYAEVIKDKVGLILGNKGVGKTAIVEYIMEVGRNEKTIICSTSVKNDLHFDPEAVGFFESLDVIKDRHQFKSEWLRFLTHKIAISLINENILPANKYKQEKSLLDRVTKRLPNISPWVSPNGTLKIGADITFGAQRQDDKRINYRRTLKECNESLKKADYCIWVLIDDIDDLFFPDLSRRDIAIASLLELWEAFRNNFSEIYLKIFSRADILRSLMFVGKPKLYGKFVLLEWNKSTILHMIVRRILSNQNIRAYCNKKLSINLPEIGVETNMSEAELKKVFYTVFQYSKSQGRSSKEFLISKKSVNDTRKDLFKYRFETYLSEFKHSRRQDLYPSIMKIVRKKKNQFSRDELFYLLKSAENKKKEDFNSLVRVLYDIGFILPADIRDIDYAMEFKLPFMYQDPIDDKGDALVWLYNAATDAGGILPREVIFILNEAKKNELKSMGDIQ